MGREVKVPQPADHIMAAAPGPWERVLVTLFKRGGFLSGFYYIIYDS